MSTFPDLKTAISLWRESLAGVAGWADGQRLREYIFHTSGVGEAAAKIASRCGLVADKAYVFGLLHDYGKKQNEKATGRSHFIVGFEDMNAAGWTDVARICLTHSFPYKNIVFDDYTQYGLRDLQTAKELISRMEYDDYDRLIQFCDMLFEGTQCINFKQRLKCIRARYSLAENQTVRLETKAAENKAYFDSRCKCNVYDILGIKE